MSPENLVPTANSAEPAKALMPKAPKRRFRFFAPFRHRDREIFETKLRERFTMCGVLNEGIIEYVDRVLDRQINKANGLLAFNGLLFTALSVANSGRSATPTSVKIGSAFALFAAIILILLLVVSFGAGDDYDSTSSDFKVKCRTIYLRTNTICISVMFSITAAMFSLWQLRWFSL
jgi:hypothetical protein